jgi:PEP-CTERM motif
MKRTILSAAIALHFAVTTNAATSTWSAAASGNWLDAVNWSPNTFFPNNGNGGVNYDAIINATGANYTVTLNGSVTVDSVTLDSANATLSHTVGTLTSALTTLTAGTLNVNGGTISGGNINVGPAGTLSFGTSVNSLLTGVAVNGDLTLAVSSARVRIGGGTTFGTAHLAANSSEIGFLAGATMNGAIVIEGAGGLDRLVGMSTAGTLTIGATGSIRNNAGVLSNGSIGAGNQFGAAMALVNQGLISSQVSARTMTINPATSFANSGVIEAINGGILTITTPNWTNTGTINIGAGSVLNLGPMDATGGIGTFNNTGGTVNVNGTLNNAGNSILLNNSTGSWTVAGGTLSGGMVNFADGRTLSFTSSVSNQLTGVTVNGDLTLSAVNARARIGPGTTFTTAHLANQTAELGFSPGAVMNGTILMEGATGGNDRYVGMTAAGTLTIGATGVVRSNTGLGAEGQIGAGNQFTGAMALTNQGLISSQVSGRAIIINPATSFANSGTIEAISGGTLTITTPNWTNTGTVNVGAGSVVNLGPMDATGGIGTFNNTGGTVNINGVLNNTGNTILLNGSTGSWTVAGGTLSGGTVNFADGASLLFNSSINNLLAGVAVNGDISLTLNAARVRIGVGTTFATARLANSNAEIGFLAGTTMSNTILLEGAGSAERVIGMNTAGTLTLAPAGVIRSNTGLVADARVGSGNQFTAAMALTNQGLISSQVSGRTITINPATSFANSGTIEATSGGILTITAPNWTNTGTINVGAGSVVNLGPMDATGGIGTFNNTGGTVNINGTLNNAGNTILLNSSTGSWTVAGGTLSGGAVNFADGASLLFSSSINNLLTGVAVNGDLNLTLSGARARIGVGTTFGTARLANLNAEIGFLAGATMSNTILMEGAGSAERVIGMNTAGTLTIGPTGVVRTNTGLGSDARIGVGNQFTAAMALTNQGLISSQVSGRTMTINPATSFANSGTIEATGGGILTITTPNWTNAGTVAIGSGSVVNLGSLDATGGIGTFNNTGGTVNINGTLNNTGNTILLNGSTGSWTVAGGTLSGGTVNFADGASMLFNTSINNLLTGVAVNGDLNLTLNGARARIGAGTTFGTARLANQNAELGFLAGATMSNTILLEGAPTVADRVIGMSTAGTLTIGPTGVVRTNTGLGSDARIGVGNQFAAAMALTNQGLISSQVSGRTITINPVNGFTNSGVIEAINGGVLRVVAGYTQSAGTTRLDNGTLDITDTGGGVFTASLSGGQLEGRGTINGRVANSSIIAPGFPTLGALAILHDLTLAETSSLRFDIGGTSQGTQYDYLTEAGALPLSLDGTLSLTLVNGFVPSPGDMFTIIHSNANLGPGLFDNIAPGGRLETTDGLGSFVVNYGTGSPDVVLTNFLIPEPATSALALLGLGVLVQRRRRR